MSILLKESVASLRKSLNDFIGVIKQRIDKIPIDNRNYLCFTASQASVNVTLNRQGSPVNLAFEYSTDKINWRNFVIGQTYTLANAGDKIWIRNLYDTQYSNTSFSNQNQYLFTFNGYIKASGNIMSLLYRSFETANTLPPYCFYYLFAGCQTLETAPELPATTLATYCYTNMFANCRSLREAPALPAVNLAPYCYTQMFAFCYSLQVAPVLPATTMVEGCYQQMFYGSGLKTPPLLPATSLATRCYKNMFAFCKCLDLSNSPTSENWHPNTVFTLPATTLAQYCYASMFGYCTSLTEMPKISATTLANHCCQSMFTSCKNLKKVYDLTNATTMAEYCYSSMFANCTSLEFPPALPATTLASYCYNGMFSGCTSLKYFKTEGMLYTSISLPATTMAEYCYNQMFLGCTSLTSAPTLNGTTLATGCYNEMFYGCTKLKYVKTVTKDLTSTYANNWLQSAAQSGAVVCPHDDTQTVLPSLAWVKVDYANLNVYDAKPSEKTFVDEKNLPDGAKLAILPGTDRFALYCSRSNYSTETKTFHFVPATNYWDTGVNFANIMLAPNETVVSDAPTFIIVSPLISGKKNNCMIWFDGSDSSRCYLYTLSVEDL